MTPATNSTLDRAGDDASDTYEGIRAPTASSGALVVFGGASGIGLATAALGTSRFDSTIIADVDAKATELDVVRRGLVEVIHCDAGDPAAVSSSLQSIVDRYGRLAAVVTTVGGAHLREPLDLDLAAWRAETTFNLDTAYVVATAAARIMVAQGGGAIVTTSSTYAEVPKADRIGYAAAKAGVIALTKSLALATAGQGVRINCVAPGSTDTPRFRAMVGSSAALEERHRISPQRHIATPEDAAEAILFLASPQARSITGQVLWVNNGNFMP